MDMNAFKLELQERKERIDKSLLKYLVKEDTHPAVIHQAMHYAVFNGENDCGPCWFWKVLP